MYNYVYIYIYYVYTCSKAHPGRTVMDSPSPTKMSLIWWWIMHAESAKRCTWTEDHLEISRDKCSHMFVTSEKKHDWAIAKQYMNMCEQTSVHTWWVSTCINQYKPPTIANPPAVLSLLQSCSRMGGRWLEQLQGAGMECAEVWLGKSWENRIDMESMGGTL